jgi:hypothetical protein
VNRLIDYPNVPRGFPSPENVWFGAVYRARNAALVEQILSGRADGWNVHLWALDEVAPRLAGLTRGSGKGGKAELLQRLLDDHAPAPSSWIVLSDDDYRFRRGSLVDLLGLACAANPRTAVSSTPPTSSISCALGWSRGGLTSSRSAPSW